VKKMMKNATIILVKKMIIISFILLKHEMPLRIGYSNQSASFETEFTDYDILTLVDENHAIRRPPRVVILGPDLLPSSATSRGDIHVGYSVIGKLFNISDHVDSRSLSRL